MRNFIKKLIKFLSWPGYRPSREDLKNEARLRILYNKIINTENPEAKRVLWKRYSEIHNARSPEMVVHLEKQRGIYRG